MSRDRAAIAGGAADSASESVFLLISHQEDSGGLCTATLIAPNLLLTARHCVSPHDSAEVLCGDSSLGEPLPGGAFIVTNAAQPNRDSTFFRGAEVRVPTQGEDTCGYDVALLILEENVPSEVSTPSVPRIDREVRPGERYAAVGYGLDEDGNAPGRRMRRDGLEVACEPGSCGEGVESTEFLGDTGICSGDSGGPALDADGKVVGVVSRGGPDCSNPIYGTVTAWRTFLTAAAAEAAELGGYEPSYWVTTGLSEPPVLPGAGGAAGVAGAGNAAPDAAEGEACSQTIPCGAGLICYAEGGLDSPASCLAPCSSVNQCADGEECRPLGPELPSVCALPAGKLDEAGCTVSAAGPPSQATWLGLAGLALLGWRRRKRPTA